ncbi:MAG TPA: hypothetical protein VGQ41_11320 [Pyrinomonadaceae bacterium]|jgi:hypothetical protein|nr:hypothetical protein [Pyrinomonadaceae bacterium]
MNCFRKTPTSSGAPDSSEIKAVLFALLACLLFIGFLTAFHWLGPRNRRQVTIIRSDQVPPPPLRPFEKPRSAPQVSVEVPPPPFDLNARFRVVPSNFRTIDFKNHSYGNYRLSDGRDVDLALTGGQFRHYGGSSHWFDFNDAYYTDLTGDGSPEAIVMLTHLECFKTCDGGKNLLFIYGLNSQGFSEILRYESGSGQGGCSLRSLTVKNRRLALELYGKCPQRAGQSNDWVIRDTFDVTRIDFALKGQHLVPKKSTVFTVSECNEVSYAVEVHIENERSLAADTGRPRTAKSSVPCT